MKVLIAALLALMLIPVAWAGSPHFVGDPTLTQSGNTLTVSGKLAGLGNEDQVHVVLSATAECINPGNNKPQAANKETVTAEGDFPVQNGKALFTLSATPTFQPNCSPPMTVRFSNVTVTDTTHNLVFTF